MAEVPRFVRFAQALAFVGIGCSPAPAPTTASAPPSASGTTSSSSAPATGEPSSKSPTLNTQGADSESGTEGAGPCRCSWDTNATAAGRLCRKSEINYAGDACIPGDRKPKPHPPIIMKGPLPPPDLPDTRFV